jgi:hypothetical protein
VDKGNNKVSRTSLLAHAASFLVVGVAIGLGAPAAANYLHRAQAPSNKPRDVYVMSPATEDTPPMLMWVAAELDDAANVRPTTQTLTMRIAPANHENLPPAPPPREARY